MKSCCRKLVKAVVACAVLSCLLVHPSWAADFRSEELITIKADEVIDGDLYLVGNDVTIDGTIKGDVIGFARLININGTVEGDVNVAAQCVVLNGKIEDGARLAGQVLKITSKAKVGNDVMAGGFSLETEDGCAIDGDVVYAGYQAKLGGAIVGDVKAGLANCEIVGTVGGDVQLEVGESDGDPQMYFQQQPPPVSMPRVPTGLTIGDKVKIDGKLTYQSPHEGKIAAAATIVGGSEHTLPKAEVAQTAPPPKTLFDVVFSKVRHFICVAIVGLGLLVVFPRGTQRVADTIRTKPAASFGGGVLGMVLFWVGIAVMIFAIVVVSILLGVATLGELIPWIAILGGLTWLGLLGGFFFFATFVAEAIASYTLGRTILFAKGAESRFLAFVLGIVIFGALSSIPVVGWLFGTVAFFVALGAMLVVYRTAPPSPQSEPILEAKPAM